MSKYFGSVDSIFKCCFSKVEIIFPTDNLKDFSSRMIRKKNYPSITKKLVGGALWSPSYFAESCGGAPIEFIRLYIEATNTRLKAIGMLSIWQ